jgi:prepilin-type N-terminal cleavage/methylation domain-containing protein
VKNKLGFSLIEIIIAVLIGSFLTVSLYQILTKAQQAVKNINVVIDLDTPLMSMYNNLEKDFIGLFVPNNIEKADQKTTGTVTKPESKEKENTIKNVFISSQEGGAVNFNFVTTAGLKVLNNKGEVIPAPYLRRVVYSLEKDPQDPDTYILWYGQTENLDPENIKNIQRYELAWRIKQFDISFKVYEPEKESKDKKSEKKLVTLTKFDPKEVVEKYKTVIPAFIEIKGRIIDQTGNREQPFNFNFTIPGYKYPEAQNNQKSEPQEKPAPETGAKVANNSSKVKTNAITSPPKLASPLRKRS